MHLVFSILAGFQGKNYYANNAIGIPSSSGTKYRVMCWPKELL